MRSRFVDVDITALLTQIIEIYEPMIVDSGHYLETALPAKPVGTVRGDRELLMEMFVNFIENSILHCQSGTTIRIGLQRVKGGINVVISDNGPGVPSSEVENLYRRFYRLDASRAKPGHGLGVPCSVAIAELHGAVVEFGDNKSWSSGDNIFPHRPRRRNASARSAECARVCVSSLFQSADPASRIIFYPVNIVRMVRGA